MTAILLAFATIALQKHCGLLEPGKVTVTGWTVALPYVVIFVGYLIVYSVRVPIILEVAVIKGLGVGQVSDLVSTGNVLLGWADRTEQATWKDYIRLWEGDVRETLKRFGFPLSKFDDFTVDPPVGDLATLRRRINNLRAIIS